MAENNDFWWFHDPGDQSLRLEWDSSAGRKNVITQCAVNPSHRGSSKRTGDLHVLLPTTFLPDVLWTWYGECVVQDKVLQLFISESYTGFQIRPVYCRWKQPSTHELPKLWELQIRGWGGVARPESGIQRIERCNVCGHQLYTPISNADMLIDTRQWDGSDFFIVWPMPLYIWISNRVAKLIERERVQGAQLNKADYLSEHTSGKGFGPGGLRNWVPEEMARAIGEPLDVY